MPYDTVAVVVEFADLECEASVKYCSGEILDKGSLSKKSLHEVAPHPKTNVSNIVYKVFFFILLHFKELNLSQMTMSLTKDRHYHYLSLQFLDQINRLMRYQSINFLLKQIHGIYQYLIC